MKLFAVRLLCVMSVIFVSFPAAAHDMTATNGTMPATCNMKSGAACQKSGGCRINEHGECGCGDGCTCGNKAGRGMGMGMGARMTGMGGIEMMKCKMCHMTPEGSYGMKGMGPMGMMGSPMMRSLRTPDYYLDCRDTLNLTDDQIEKLVKLKERLREDTIMKGATVMVLELQLSDIVADTAFKLSDADAKLKQIEAARLELRQTVIKTAAAARNTLTKDQLEQLKKLSLSGGKRSMSHGGAKRDMMEKMMREKMEKMK
ncbi:MAG: Spy/CpxP family protein refolding chaperone [Nitrospirota bacterium]